MYIEHPFFYLTTSMIGKKGKDKITNQECIKYILFDIILIIGF